MEKRKAINVISMMFILLMIIRVIEIVFVKTDQTWISENIIHKICCILLIWIALDMLKLRWSDLGFSKKGVSSGLKYGLALGISTFFLSYVAEFIVLSVMGKHPALQFYITNFSLSQIHTNGSSLLAVVVCLIGNIVNVWAEEGLFRGLFRIIGIQCYSPKTANIIQALLFGIWHITNIIIPVLDGSMNIVTAVFMGIGYVLLSEILAYEWGMCAALTGTLWTGASEHLFNNFISNSLHTVTETGADEMMIIRITLSNVLSLIFVLIISRKRKLHNK
ncbi:MAG: CPBP family intramembrane metalloprotease [Lachnospiraceae bacterium]|nr:CPBP family intramembrane metalloprotease [Lachnospiraceae bacterium]